MGFFGFRPYVPVAKRRLKALKEAEKLKKKGRVVSPVAIEGGKIAQSFWGKAWCDNLERYSDFENRLPRGRTYVRNGSVIELQVARGKVEALVSGSEIYRVKVDIAVAAPTRWTAICRDCAGSVGSLVELLQGKLSKNVMERVCREADGLFPAPSEIKMSCSCPDWADMCKHVAATLYGVGARLDTNPDALFALRGVDRAELVSIVGADLPFTRATAASERVLADDNVAALFGIDIAAPDAPAAKDGVEKKRQAREPAAASAPAPPKKARNEARAARAEAPAVRPPPTGSATIAIPAAARSSAKAKKSRKASGIHPAKRATRSMPAAKKRRVPDLQS
jgi:uncharacterized Zn finger protein